MLERGYSLHLGLPLFLWRTEAGDHFLVALYPPEKNEKCQISPVLLNTSLRTGSLKHRILMPHTSTWQKCWICLVQNQMQILCKINVTQRKEDSKVLHMHEGYKTSRGKDSIWESLIILPWGWLNLHILPKASLLEQSYRTKIDDNSRLFQKTYILKNLCGSLRLDWPCASRDLPHDNLMKDPWILMNSPVGAKKFCCNLI